MTLNTKEFIHALTQAKYFTRKHKVLASTSAVRLSIDGNYLFVAVSNGDQYYEHILPCQLDKRDHEQWIEPLLINATSLLSVLKRLKSDDMHVIRHDYRLTIQHDDERAGSFNLMGNTLKYWIEPRSIGTERYRLTTHNLSSALKTVSKYQSKERRHPHLQGVSIQSMMSGLRVAATDSHRANTAPVQSSSPIEYVWRHTLPSHAVNGLQRIKDCKSWNHLAFTDAHAVIDGPDWSLTTALVTSGVFPDVDSIEPADDETVIRIPRETLQYAVNGVSTLCHKDYPNIRLTYDRNSLELLIQTVASPNGQAAFYADHITHVDGLPFDIGVNYNYLKQCLAAMTCDVVELREGDGRLRVIGDNQTHIIMQMRLHTYDSAHSQAA